MERRRRIHETGFRRRGLFPPRRPDRAVRNVGFGTESGNRKPPQTCQPAGRLRLDDFSLDLWATNAFDEEYVSNAFFIANQFTVDYRPTLGPPLRYGATLRYSF